MREGMVLAAALFEKITGKKMEELEFEKIPPDALIKLLWDLMPLFHEKYAKLKSCRYEEQFAGECDEAIRKVLETSDLSCFDGMSLQAWRVLGERWRQLVETCVANEMAGNPAIMSLPLGVGREDRLLGAIGFWLHDMQLPFPVNDQWPAGWMSEDGIPSSWRTQ